MSWIEDFKQVRSAHRLVIDAETRTRQALDRNPGVPERRRLNAMLVELGNAQSKLASRRTAIIRERRAIVNPTPEQVNRIKALTMEVQNQTNSAMAASMTLGFASQVLGLANELVG